MKTLRQLINLLNESKTTVYHSDDYGITKLDTQLMVGDISKNKEGPGIYFTTNKDVKYGKHTVKTDVDPNRFFDSRMKVGKLPKAKLMNFMKALWKHDPEEFYYFISDYVELDSEDAVTIPIISEFLKTRANEELRNFQLEIVNSFGEAFINLWVKHLDTDGNKFKYTNTEDWYIIMNSKQKITL